jgi:hypothetical protein
MLGNNEGKLETLSLMENKGILSPQIPKYA